MTGPQAGFERRMHSALEASPSRIPVILGGCGTGRTWLLQRLIGSSDRYLADIAAKVQSDLRQVGIAAEPRILEWGTLLNHLQTPDLRDFDAVIVGWVTEFRIDDTDLFHCDKRDDPFQWVGHCDPETDRLLEALPRIVDREQAKPLWAEYQRKIARDQPYTFLYFQERLEGVSERLRNVDPDARGDWVGASKWWILPSARGNS